MDKKKIGIGIVALIIIILAAYLCIGFTTNPDVELGYDDHFGVTIPSNFEMKNTSTGDVEYCVSPDKSYIVCLSDLTDVVPKNMESTFKDLKDAKDLGLQKTKSYKVGDVKAYDFTVTKSDKNKEWFKSMKMGDYKYSRIIAFIIPGAKKTYCIKILTNDSSVNLHSPEIKDIIETVDEYQFLNSN